MCIYHTKIILSWPYSVQCAQKQETLQCYLMTETSVAHPRTLAGNTLFVVTIVVSINESKPGIRKE